MSFSNPFVIDADEELPTRIDPRFERWIRQGRKRLFTDGETEKLWQIWNWIKELACYARISSDGDIIIVDDHFSGGSDGPFDIESRDLYDDDTATLSKDDYFNYVLECSTPEQVIFCEYNEFPSYRFPSLTCRVLGCQCKMEPAGMKEFHHWDVSN